jgi:hypothetical protein
MGHGPHGKGKYAGYFYGDGTGADASMRPVQDHYLTWHPGHLHEEDYPAPHAAAEVLISTVHHPAP